MLPSRADFLVKQTENTQAILDRLERAKAHGAASLQIDLSEIIDEAKRGELELKLGDRICVLLALRSISSWSTMVTFSDWADKTNQQEGQLRFTSIPEVRQQYAMALNREGGWKKSILAEDLLIELINQKRDSELFGILGRVYKDRWLKLRKNDPRSRGFLISALNAYWDGLECNSNEIYPAINALTLLRVSGVEPQGLRGLASHIAELLNERFARKADYFDYATRLEFCAAMREIGAAWDVAHQALDIAPASWELETTANNLRILSLLEPGVKELMDFLLKEAEQRKPPVVSGATASAA